ncbi:uncharacterized protein MELLADRAFT_89213 [Melampsora larici-populina 98AG31]|uniref:GCM domain-containing protein n=1 Tax=Melampsora larici-populina (strain 98AG31 / pathotype 3-4-7) TaxID=747676 RepID=F4R5C3_MELLP|nr:uncharacterized protein MELLADRAFT_89213 [Melampsora larici-populina 98AG31]EGG12287.1 hypothetical protein MELLADRAFT_89213 [Melampsora larici-populina 98AG31]
MRKKKDKLLLKTSSKTHSISTAPKKETSNAQHIKQFKIKSKKLQARLKERRKKFTTPHNPDMFKTFIDHGTIMDAQSYPLFINGSTTYVTKDTESITNWGTFGYTYTMSGGDVKGRWKTTRYKCLGVLKCTNESCKYRGSPPTGRTKISKLVQQQKPCKVPRCPGIVIHVACKDTFCRLDECVETQWGLLRHIGTHDHPWPVRTKADKISKEEFATVVKNNSKSKPMQLKTGQALAGKKPIKSVSTIHVAYRNRSRIASERRSVLKDAGIISDKKGKGVQDEFVIDMLSWAKRGLDIIYITMTPANAHISFQTKWMKERLLTIDDDGRAYSGGLLTDVTYKLFATGYLCSTTMYDNDLCRWIPVLFTWLSGLSEAHYHAHFLQLMKMVKDAPITPPQRDSLIRTVVDFSAAQKNGFIQAYMDVFEEYDRDRALSRLNGCQEHYRASVTRLKRNFAVTGGQEDVFEGLALGLLKKSNSKTHDEKLDELRRTFPKAKNWIDWWQTSDIKAMLFRSRQPQMDDFDLSEDELPETTNAQESMHRVIYMISVSELTGTIYVVRQNAPYRLEWSSSMLLSRHWSGIMKMLCVESQWNMDRSLGTTRQLLNL